MASPQPTQPLPPYLTLLTLPPSYLNSTQSLPTIVTAQLPLVYSGPSIPLGWPWITAGAGGGGGGGGGGAGRVISILGGVGLQTLDSMGRVVVGTNGGGGGGGGTGMGMGTGGPSGTGTETGTGRVTGTGGGGGAPSSGLPPPPPSTTRGTATITAPPVTSFGTGTGTGTGTTRIGTGTGTATGTAIGSLSTLPNGSTVTILPSSLSPSSPAQPPSSVGGASSSVPNGATTTGSSTISTLPNGSTTLVPVPTATSRSATTNPTSNSNSASTVPGSISTLPNGSLTTVPGSLSTLPNGSLTTVPGSLSTLPNGSTTTNFPLPTSFPQNLSRSGLSGGQVAGIVIGSVAGLVLVLLGCCLCASRYRKGRRRGMMDSADGLEPGWVEVQGPEMSETGGNGRYSMLSNVGVGNVPGAGAAAAGAGAALGGGAALAGAAASSGDRGNYTEVPQGRHSRRASRGSLAALQGEQAGSAGAAAGGGRRGWLEGDALMGAAGAAAATGVVASNIGRGSGAASRRSRRSGGEEYTGGRGTGTGRFGGGGVFGFLTGRSRQSRGSVPWQSGSSGPLSSGEEDEVGGSGMGSGSGSRGWFGGWGGFGSARRSRESDAGPMLGGVGFRGDGARTGAGAGAGAGEERVGEMRSLAAGGLIGVGAGALAGHALSQQGAGRGGGGGGGGGFGGNGGRDLGESGGFTALERYRDDPPETLMEEYEGTDADVEDLDDDHDLDHGGDEEGEGEDAREILRDGGARSSSEAVEEGSGGRGREGIDHDLLGSMALAGLGGAAGLAGGAALASSHPRPGLGRRSGSDSNQTGTSATDNSGSRNSRMTRGTSRSGPPGGDDSPGGGGGGGTGGAGQSRGQGGKDDDDDLGGGRGGGGRSSGGDDADIFYLNPGRPSSRARTVARKPAPLIDDEDLDQDDVVGGGLGVENSEVTPKAARAGPSAVGPSSSSETSRPDPSRRFTEGATLGAASGAAALGLGFPPLGQRFSDREVARQRGKVDSDEEGDRFDKLPSFIAFNNPPSAGPSPRVSTDRGASGSGRGSWATGTGSGPRRSSAGSSAYYSAGTQFGPAHLHPPDASIPPVPGGSGLRSVSASATSQTDSAGPSSYALSPSASSQTAPTTVPPSDVSRTGPAPGISRYSPIVESEYRASPEMRSRMSNPALVALGAGAGAGAIAAAMGDRSERRSESTTSRSGSGSSVLGGDRASGRKPSGGILASLGGGFANLFKRDRGIEEDRDDDRASGEGSIESVEQQMTPAEREMLREELESTYGRGRPLGVPIRRSSPGYEPVSTTFADFHQRELDRLAQLTPAELATIHERSRVPSVEHGAEPGPSSARFSGEAPLSPLSPSASSGEEAHEQSSLLKRSNSPSQSTGSRAERWSYTTLGQKIRRDPTMDVRSEIGSLQSAGQRAASHSSGSIPSQRTRSTRRSASDSGLSRIGSIASNFGRREQSEASHHSGSNGSGSRSGGSHGSRRNNSSNGSSNGHVSRRSTRSNPALPQIEPPPPGKTDSGGPGEPPYHERGLIKPISTRRIRLA